MALNIVGLFDSMRDARAALEALKDAGFNDRNMSLVASDARGEYSTDGGDTGATAAGAAGGATGGAMLGGLTGLLVGLAPLVIPGIGPVIAGGTLAGILGTTAAGAGLGAAAGGLVGALTNAGVPEEDANIYAEGIRRGGALLSVEADSEADADRVAGIMNQYNVVNIDRRGEEYRQAGWTRFDPNAEPYHLTTHATEGSDVTTQVSTTMQPATGEVAQPAMTTVPSVPVASGRVETTTRSVEQGDRLAVPIIEEQLRVGKREVEAGGVRVYKRVVETPFSEQVTVRDEHVRVERRPVERPVTDADLQKLRQTPLEIRERDQQVVVEKQARIVEEVVVRKEAAEHIETIEDTVRRTNVDIQEIPGQARATGSTRTSTAGSSSVSGGSLNAGTAGNGGGQEGMLERGLSKAANAVEGGTGVDLDRDGDVGRRDPRNNF